MDKMREEFEAACRARGFATAKWQDNSYASADTADAWLAFQAAYTAGEAAGVRKCAEVCSKVHNDSMLIHRGTTTADPDHARFKFQSYGTDECRYKIEGEFPQHFTEPEL